jgi:hypothetical protein
MKLSPSTFEFIGINVDKRSQAAALYLSFVLARLMQTIRILCVEEGGLIKDTVINQEDINL